MVRKTCSVVFVITAGFALAASAGDSKKLPAKPEVQVEAPRQAGEPAKVKTKVGTFEVSPKNAELLERALSGDKAASETIYAGGADF